MNDGTLRQVSDLNDPRVLFAAERTLLAWNRTGSGLMALGFFIERGSLITEAAGANRNFAVWIGLAFLLLGVVLNFVAVLQFRRTAMLLRPVEIPEGYWINLAVVATLGVAILGLLLGVYLLLAL